MKAKGTGTRTGKVSYGNRGGGIRVASVLGNEQIMQSVPTMSALTSHGTCASISLERVNREDLNDRGPASSVKTVVTTKRLLLTTLVHNIGRDRSDIHVSILAKKWTIKISFFTVFAMSRRSKRMKSTSAV